MLIYTLQNTQEFLLHQKSLKKVGNIQKSLLHQRNLRKIELSCKSNGLKQQASKTFPKKLFWKFQPPNSMQASPPFLNQCPSLHLQNQLKG